MSEALSLLKALIERPSVTPDDAGCQPLIASRLEKLGFSIEWFSTGHVTNLWARRGTSKPLICLAGHTDVVPPGNYSAWAFPPFSGVVFEGKCYGRGAADMKGGVAAGIVAIERYLALHPDSEGSIAVLLTSDEEGLATEGTAKVVRQLAQRGEHIDYCLLMEPTSDKVFGDLIQNGRRGSLDATLTIEGIQGHVAHAELAKNPILAVAPLIADWSARQWDEGNEYFPPTSFQVSSIHSGAGAANVIPGLLSMAFNFRYSPAIDIASIKAVVEEGLDQADIEYELIWDEPALPYLTEPGKLVTALQQAITQATGITAELTTHGGASDGRFLIAIADEVVEFGLMTETIHKIDEQVDVEHLEQLGLIYYQTLATLLNRFDD